MEYICVYGASKNEIPQEYKDCAYELGRLIAKSGRGVVNGGGKAGIMRATTDGAMNAGGEAVGVLPRFMIDNGWQYDSMTRLVVTGDMHERKQTMAQMSCAAVAMPGGIGTLEEFLEIITWRQLGLFDKPVVLMDINGYYTDLVNMLRKCGEQGFMREFDGDLWSVATNAQEAMAIIEKAR